MLKKRFAWWRRPPRPVSPRRRSEEPPVLLEDERPLGCGWFDSSHDLQRGLLVIDRDPPGVSAPASAARTADRCG